MLDNWYIQCITLSDSVKKGLLYTPQMGEHHQPEEEISFEQKRGVNYQHEYMRLYIANVVLTQQLKELLQEKGDLVQKISRLEVFLNLILKDSEINRMCQKIEDNGEQQKRAIKNKPSTEGSLNQNVKKSNNENLNPNQHQYQTRKIKKC